MFLDRAEKGVRTTNVAAIVNKDSAPILTVFVSKEKIIKVLPLFPKIFFYFPRKSKSRPKKLLKLQLKRYKFVIYAFQDNTIFDSDHDPFGILILKIKLTT